MPPPRRRFYVPAEHQQGRRGAHRNQRHGGSHQGREETQADGLGGFRPAPRECQGKGQLVGEDEREDALQGNRQGGAQDAPCERQASDFQQVDPQDLAPSATQRFHDGHRVQALLHVQVGHHGDTQRTERQGGPRGQAEIGEGGIQRRRHSPVAVVAIVDNLAVREELLQPGLELSGVAAGANPKEQPKDDGVAQAGDPRAYKSGVGKHHPGIRVGRRRQAIRLGQENGGDAESHAVEKHPVTGRHRQALGKDTGDNRRVRFQRLAQRPVRLQFHRAVPRIAPGIHAAHRDHHRIRRLIRGDRAVGFQRVALFDALAGQFDHGAALFFGRRLAQRDGGVGGDPMAHVAVEAAGELAAERTRCIHGRYPHGQGCHGHHKMPASGTQIAPRDLARYPREPLPTGHHRQMRPVARNGRLSRALAGFRCRRLE